MRRSVLTNTDFGESIRLVGYGYDDGTALTGLGVKREVTVSINGLDIDDISVGKAGATGCNGNSGGPAFYHGEIAGVASYGYRGCNRVGYYTRVHLYRDFIDPYVN